MNFMIFLMIITAMLLVYCSIVIPLANRLQKKNQKNI